mmetsp:Transcript_11277/g.37274  ORF Transcript_11277/g.37274 Transcript_11277/m.37274 type:complete len:264 (+) Transcript_11277:879-1670(+)
MAAAVQVVELALGDGVVDVDCGEQEFAGFLHFVQPFHAGGGFLGNPDAGANGALPPLGVLHQVLRDRLQHQLHLRVVRGGRVGNRAALLELELGLVTLVDEKRGVTAVVDDDVQVLGTPVEHLVGAPPVLLQSFALPREHRGGVARDRRGGVILGGEDVARAPPDHGAEGDQGLDEHRGLDGHVQGAGDVRALQGLGGAELLDHGHQAGHLDFREFNLEATEVSHGHVLDLVFATGDGLDGAHSGGGRHLCRNMEGRWGRSVA